MSNDKRNALLLVFTYIFTTFINKPIDSILKMKSYNPFVDGLQIKLLISFSLWVITSLIIYYILGRFVFKKTAKN